MSLCREWMESELLVGTIYPITSARFMYNGNAVGEGGIEFKITYNEFIPAFEIQLTITDATTNTYTYNQIAIIDQKGYTVALFTYSQAYSKGTGSLTVNETIVIQDTAQLSLIDKVFFGTTIQDWNEILANAIAYGGTIPLPNIIIIIDLSSQPITQIQFTPSINITSEYIEEYQTINCNTCNSLLGEYFILGNLDQSTKTFTMINSFFLSSGFTTANFVWSIPFNPNC